MSGQSSEREANERVDDGEYSVCKINRPNGDGDSSNERLGRTAVQVRVVGRAAGTVVAPNGDGEGSRQTRQNQAGARREKGKLRPTARGWLGWY